MHCLLDEQKGMEIGETYRTRKQAKTFIGYIAQAEKERVQKEFAAGKFLSLMSDGCTDSAVIEEEIIYGRQAVKGQISVKFLGIEAVTKANAENITSAITAGLGLEEGTWKKKLVAVSTDGAAVMLGGKSGVVTRLTADLPHVLPIHCMPHRLELSFKDDASKNPCHKKLDALLTGLYTFYHYSPLNRANLKASFESLGKKPLMPTRATGTRWVSHLLTALDHFLRGYSAIVQHLEQIQSPDSTGVRSDQQAKARNYYRAATSLDVIKYTWFLFDVLAHLSNLSRKMQKTNVTMAALHEALQSTKTVLLTYKRKPGPMLQSFGNKTTFEGRELSGDGRSFQSSHPNLIDDLVANTENRFGHVKGGVLHATNIADFGFWPDKVNMTDFGDAAVDILVGHFKPVLEDAGVQVDKVADEWTILRSKVYQQPDWLEFIKKVTWCELNRRYFEECPNVLQLVDLLLTLPASTAECERGFNHMKMIKSDWRSSLSGKSVGELMSVLLLSADIKNFDPKPAINIWFHDVQQRRRLDFMDGKTSTAAEMDDAEPEEDFMCVGQGCLLSIMSKKYDDELDKDFEVE
uniref:HAT C-terminal dimerisation domain-containing protein n=2 Tax=Nothobranchius korthausae TaxID=1143690 RepID=A0A1A8GAA0_9TELE